MYSKNVVKARKRAKLRKAFFINLMIFIPASLILLGVNIGLIERNEPWSLIIIMPWLLVLVIMRFLTFKLPQRTIFSRDYLSYQTEKEYRILEFEDEMDEIEAEALQREKLDLYPINQIDKLHNGLSEGELV